MDQEAKRLQAVRAVLATIHRSLALEIGFVLWDGSRVPEAWPADGPAFALRDSGVVARLVRCPTLDTVIGMHVAGRIDLVNATWFDIADRRPRGKLKKLLREVGIGPALGLAARFLTAPGGPASPLAAVKAEPGARDGTEATNRRNVAYHYDISNAFYRLFLDREMVYTCAYFAEWHDDIDRAQRDKLDMICRKLRLQAGERFLDIGCGWGALVCHAAEHYGVEAHGVTLAAEQLAMAKERAAARGLSDRVHLHLMDYARMEGSFDKIASIGMFEQVGIANYPTYFRAVHRLLQPRGLYLHHSIARRTRKPGKSFRKHTPEYRALTRYIFPGGELDTLEMSIGNLERYGFEVHDVEGWREHYQRTTRLWHDRLLARRAEAEAEVGPEKTRMWLLYLAGCSLAFARGSVGIFQTLASTRTRGPAGLPPSRADLYR